MAELLRDRQRLLRHKTALNEQAAARQLSHEEFEALAECNFRLAISPDTGVGEALRLLKECVRLDSTNPKYAYHLARLYFAHGQLLQARHWLQVVCRQCPTSHRVWAHVSLLLWELNTTTYYGDHRFEPNALLKRGEKIACSIHAGEDCIDAALLDFDPPERLEAKKNRESQGGQPDARSDELAAAAMSGATAGAAPRGPVRRWTRHRECRWTGVRDALLEMNLEGSPSQRVIEILAEMLERVARLADRRPGGVAAFVIQATQWMVSGYPVATVRRLRATIPQRTDCHPSLELLERVCAVYEAPEDEVPQLLADGVEADRLPPILAAVLHRRRVLWRPREFRGLEAYRLGRRFLAEARGHPPADKEEARTRTARATELANRLEHAIAALDPPPPASLKDVVKADGTRQTPTAEDAWAAFDQLDKAADRLVFLHEKTLNFLKGDFDRAAKEAKDEAEFGHATADHKALGMIVGALETAAKDGLNRLGEVVKAIGALGSSQVPADFETQKESRDKRFKVVVNLGNFKTMLIRATKSLAAQRQRYSRAVGDSTPELANLLADVEGVLGTASKVPPTVCPADAPVTTAKPAAERSGLDALEYRLWEADMAVDRAAATALATFGAYSPQPRALPPLQAVRLSILGVHAETLYRMGRRAEARRTWNAMLREDRLDIGALKSIAVVDTGDGDLARAMASWRAYLEVLCFYDVVQGSPRRHAAARAEFHRALGGSYVSASLQTEKRDAEKVTKPDPDAIVALLASPVRVRNFIEHKRLEFLNYHLGYASPVLVLGTNRNDGQETREAALKRLQDFAREATIPLPPRIREAFVELCQRHFKQSAEDAADNDRRLLRKDPRYPADEDLHRQRLVDFCWFKRRLFEAVKENQQFAAQMTSVDSLVELQKLDSFPIDLSERFLTVAAGSVSIDRPTLLSLMDHLANTVVNQLLRYLLSDDGGATEDARRRQQYQRLTEEWCKRPAFEARLADIMERRAFYPEAVQRMLVSKEALPDLIGCLRRWTEAYPGIAVLAIDLADRLDNQDKPGDALATLERAAAASLTEAGKKECDRLARQIRPVQARQSGDAVGAYRSLLDLLNDDDRQSQLPIEMMSAYVEAARASNSDPGWRHMRKAVEGWIERTRKHMRVAPSGKERAVTEKELDQVQETLGKTLVQGIVLGAGIERKPEPDWDCVAAALDDLLAVVPDADDAYYYRMFARYKQTAEMARAGRHTQARQRLMAACDDAHHVLEHSSDEQQKQQAHEVIQT